MALVDLNSDESISQEIVKIKNTLSKLKNKKVEMEEITDSEPEQEPEQEQEQEQEPEQQEEEYNPEIKEEEQVKEEEQKVEEVKVKEQEKEKEQEQEKEQEKDKKSINLKTYTKKEVKILLSAFEVNINRLIKKYKNVDDISENELHKIQKKFDSEYNFFNKKSRKLLKRLSNYDDLTDEEYKKINSKIKSITNKFTSFIKEFIGSDNDTNSDSDNFEFSD